MPNYKVFRNVKDYGAKGDGINDDTRAIQNAISGDRCSAVSACEGSTTEPGLIYFPYGTYLISTSLKLDYYTHLVGNPLGNRLPIIKCSSNFNAGYVLDGDPYNGAGNLAWGSTNNFYREIRNLRIDMKSMNPNLGTSGIHWPVGQATALQNIVVDMSTVAGTQQQGLFIESGSGGFMSDLTFYGGKIGAVLGNQQFTSRNMTFHGCQTAISQIWNWNWLHKSLSINNCAVGIDMSVKPGLNESVGGITVLDSHFYNTGVGIITSASAQSTPKSAGQILLDNVYFENTPVAVQSTTNQLILQGNQKIASWGQGHVYTSSSNTYTFNRGPLTPPDKSAVLLDGSTFLEHSRPEYLEYSINQFVTVKSLGAKGDGVTDDTATIQRIIDNYAATKIIFFDAGAYIHTSTVTIPPYAVIVGEVESTIMATGSFFGDAKNPKPVWAIAQQGQSGNVQIVDILFSHKGPVPGAIMMQWNLKSTCPGRSGLWSTHFRTGGAKGTNQSPLNCAKLTGAGNRPECQGAFLQLHISSLTSLYMENVWLWVADHNLDYPSHDQIDIFNARTILVESQGPLWMYGTSAEHSVFYQYHFVNAKNVFLGQAQTESAYYQGIPPAPQPFTPLTNWADPVFDKCPATNDVSCAKGWGIDIINATNMYIYNAGLYSFFQNWSTDCIGTSKNSYCQDGIFRSRGNSQKLYVWGLETVGVENMVVIDDQIKVKAKDNVGVFPDGILGYFLDGLHL
jgi:glucan 1,3-beta-glucosidase